MDSEADAPARRPEIPEQPLTSAHQKLHGADSKHGPPHRCSRRKTLRTARGSRQALLGSESTWNCVHRAGCLHRRHFAAREEPGAWVGPMDNTRTPQPRQEPRFTQKPGRVPQLRRLQARGGGYQPPAGHVCRRPVHSPQPGQLPGRRAVSGQECRPRTGIRAARRQSLLPGIQCEADRHHREGTPLSGRFLPELPEPGSVHLCDGRFHQSTLSRHQDRSGRRTGHVLDAQPILAQSLRRADRPARGRPGRVCPSFPGRDRSFEPGPAPARLHSLPHERLPGARPRCSPTVRRRDATGIAVRSARKGPKETRTFPFRPQRPWKICIHSQSGPARPSCTCSTTP